MGRVVKRLLEVVSALNGLRFSIRSQGPLQKNSGEYLSAATLIPSGNNTCTR